MRIVVEDTDAKQAKQVSFVARASVHLPGERRKAHHHTVQSMGGFSVNIFAHSVADAPPTPTAALAASKAEGAAALSSSHPSVAIDPPLSARQKINIVHMFSSKINLVCREFFMERPIFISLKITETTLARIIEYITDYIYFNYTYEPSTPHSVVPTPSGSARSSVSFGCGSVDIVRLDFLKDSGDKVSDMEGDEPQTPSASP